MREIKFRAWDEDTKKINIISPYLFEEMGWMNWDQVNKQQTFVLMQYTGLRDKNGKEIYEGDIVKGEVQFPQLLTGDTDENCNFKMAGEVFYDHTSFSLKAIQSMCDPEREGMVNYFSFIGDSGEVFEEMEIIGNIYENPELLTK